MTDTKNKKFITEDDMDKMTKAYDKHIEDELKKVDDAVDKYHRQQEALEELMSSDD